MRSTDVSTRCCRWKLRGANQCLNGLRQVIVSLVCIFVLLSVVVRANHIHQLDSNLVDDGSISANPPQKNPLRTPKSAGPAREEEKWIDKERIQLRHNFTFRVNGRELSLEPPNKRTATAATSASASASAALAPTIAKKVNRVGDSPNDYESGFEPSDPDQSVGGFEAAPASHSSALMSSSYSSSSNSDFGASSNSNSLSNSRDKDYLLEREVSNGADKSRLNLKQRQRPSGSTKQTAENDNKQGRIISDWPKNVVGGGREHSNTGAKFEPTTTTTTTDRHSSWSHNNTVTGSERQQKQQQQQLNSQLGPKYSALLSSTANAAATNELASQSGEPSQPKPRWDNNSSNNKQLLTGEQQQQQQPITGRIRLTISSKLAQTIKQPAGAFRKQHEDSSTSRATGSKTNKRGSSARKQTMRAPVHARQQYLLAADKAAASKGSLTEPEAASQDNSSIAAGTAAIAVASKTANNANSTKVEPSSIYELPSLSISEHKTNFSSTSFGGSAPPAEAKNESQLGGDPSKRTTSRANKSNIVQRDLTRANLVQASDSFRSQLPLRFKFTNEGPTFPAMAMVMSTGSGVQANATTSDNRNQRPDTMAEPKIGRSDEHMNSIVRTGPILTHPHSHLSALVPAAMALLAQAQDDQHARSSAALRMLQQPPSQAQQQLQTGQPNFAWGQQRLAESEPSARSSSTGTTGTVAPAGSMNESAQLFSHFDQMIANANHLGVAHLGPQPVGGQTPPGLGASETNNYGAMADYTDRLAADANLQSNYEAAGNSAGSSVGASQQPTANSANLSGDDQRYPYPTGDYPTDADQNQMIRPHAAGSSAPEQQITNSRSSMSPDHYMRSEAHKGPREAPASYTPIRAGSIDPFEELTGGLSASDYERDLADLDEEFSRHTAHRRPQGSLMSDSYVSLSPDRYEARRFNRRPSYADYGTGGEYLSAAGSMSNMIPRAYARSPSSWASSSPYSESSDLWSDTSLDYSPIMSPSHYAYRWRPRYQRIAAYPGGTYMAAAASEQQIPTGYSILPAYSSAGASVQPTETISFALSPLAAAAAAAASALAAADKSRHQSHAWLTLPRLTQASTASQPSLSPGQSPAASASSQHAATVPASLQPTAAYLAPHHRPGAYALSPIPIYAFAPRPQTSPALAAAAGTGVAPAPAMIPYFHGATPTLLAYRTAGVLPASSLLTAASFAYPFRVPIAATALARPPGFPMASSGRPLVAGRPYLTDLQFAETKYKSNMNNSNNSDTKSGFAKSSSTLSAMAKNLSKKVFGSASQLRPQHVAPPTNAGFELYSPSPGTALANLSQSIIK